MHCLATVAQPLVSVPDQLSRITWHVWPTNNLSPVGKVDLNSSCMPCESWRNLWWKVMPHPLCSHPEHQANVRQQFYLLQTMLSPACDSEQGRRIVLRLSAHLFWYCSSARAFQPAALSAPPITPPFNVCASQYLTQTTFIPTASCWTACQDCGLFTAVETLADTR